MPPPSICRWGGRPASCSFVPHARARGSPNLFKGAIFDLPHPLARNAVSCRQILKPDGWFGQEPRFKYRALTRVEDFHRAGKRLTPLIGFLLFGIHGFGTRRRID